MLKHLLALCLIGFKFILFSQETGQDFFEKFINKYNFKGNEIILDLCTGDGKVSAFLASKVPKGSVLGVSISDSTIYFEHKVYSARNLRFQLANPANLPFEDQFDIVTSLCSMHMLDDQKNTWAGIMRSLKPGGNALAQVPVEDGFKGALEQTMNLEKWQKKFKQFSSGWHFYTYKEYKRFVVRSGLSPLRIEYNTQETIYANKDAFIKSISPTLPHLIILSAAEKKEFLNDFVNAYLDKVPEDLNGKILYSVQYIEIEALKAYQPKL